jgi:hypothetical protein
MGRLYQSKTLRLHHHHHHHQQQQQQQQAAMNAAPVAMRKPHWATRSC